MKYLKTFESTENKFYWEINQDDSSKSRVDNIVNISNRSLKLISKYDIDGFTSIALGRIKYYRFNGVEYLLELRDDWFIITLEGESCSCKTLHCGHDNIEKYYLCDQLEGLEHFLIDHKNSIKPKFYKKDG